MQSDDIQLSVRPTKPLFSSLKRGVIEVDIEWKANWRLWVWLGNIGALTILLPILEMNHYLDEVGEQFSHYSELLQKPFTYDLFCAEPCETANTFHCDIIKMHVSDFPYPECNNDMDDNAEYEFLFLLVMPILFLALTSLHYSLAFLAFRRQSTAWNKFWLVALSVSYSGSYLGLLDCLQDVRGEASREAQLKSCEQILHIAADAPDDCFRKTEPGEFQHRFFNASDHPLYKTQDSPAFMPAIGDIPATFFNLMSLTALALVSFCMVRNVWSKAEKPIQEESIALVRRS